jgi:alpha-beta hydrolase superfamily lysophospholipase
VILRGHFHSAPGPKRKVVIIAHDNIGVASQTPWQAFARELAASGIAALTFDFRGYGETGGSMDAARLDADLDTAVRFIRSRDYTQIYLIGSGIGGTAALKVAARQDLAGVVTLSAPASYMGLNAQTDIAGITEPKLFIAVRSEAAAVTALNAFLQAASEPKQSQIFDGQFAGSDTLRLPGAKQLVLDFVAR